MVAFRWVGTLYFYVEHILGLVHPIATLLYHLGLWDVESLIYLQLIIIATEYGAGNMASTQGDVYSYGVLVLETVTGKRPTDSRFRQGLSIREYVDLALQKEVADAVDTRLSLDLENELHTGGDSSYKKKMDCVFSLLELGMSCTQELPSSRMPTGGIIKEMLAIKDSLLR
jgi:receptor kinase-like protein